ncbi:breast cancer type 2 susceptibility protein isoform X2 [Pangasianodon hypophthalmus]|uniref:breast cancer type 2 susceptibility protein isoform X2 n=1 Tax=Pangasianodon hypophthalmus TaxID=310915 RepID=UPI002307C801|nr:breast cancer type 2 susceptibility protein isoform X2 [Pangasianodon hypophthalmus]
MFDDFFHQIETELGPLNSDWFEELTVRASEDGCENSTVVEHDTTAHKDEVIFRAPAKTPVLDSQMCSTPRIFRRRRPHSPALGIEDSPESGMQNLFLVPPGAESSPCLFGFAKDSQQFEKDWGSLKTSACLDLLDTPTDLTPQSTSAQRICESLGAQLNPDLSWSSSFNTPSALTPTVILSKTEGQSPPIVRKLFPSLSKGTEATSTSISSVQHNDTLTDGNVQAEEQKSDSSSDNIGGVWRQTVPDAIKDGDVRTTVESVLNDAEDVLSFLFTNSGSALRRVKTKERKKRVNGVSKEVKSNHVTVDHTTDCTSASKTDTSTAIASLKSPLFSSQLNNKDFTQWTPLSLSDVQDSKTNQVCISEISSKHTSPHVDSSVKSDIVKNITQLGQSSSCTSEQQRFSPDSCHEKSQERSSLLEASPALTFSRKPRKFVYPVQNSESTRQHNVTDAVNHYQESPPCHKEDTHTDTRDHFVQPAETTVKQDHSASLNIDHDLDMTQLCKAFAEDFTQEVNLLKSSHKSAQSSHDRVLMPTCTAKEISEVQTKTESVMQCDGDINHQAAKIIDLTNIQSLESTICDSGYPTVCSGFSLETPSCSGNEHLHSGFKTANNKIIVILPEALMKAKAALDQSLEQSNPLTHTGTSSVTEPTKVGTNQYNSYKPVTANTAGEKLASESYHHGHKSGRETSDESVLISETAAENIPSTFMCQTNESGFKTASNKSITISSVNLEKAKDIFMELDEEKFDSCLSNNELQVCNVKDAKPSNFDLKNSRKPSQHSTGNDDGISSLTASQRADVTELCSMLEEAGSQYEFTQFYHTKIGSKCPDSMQSEREWDPEILAGIDFDDSFNCDLSERQVSKKHQSKADVHASVPNSLTNGDVGIQSINIRKSCHIPWEMPNMANDSLKEKSFCSGFKTAKGNAVTISEKCLSKARSIFADIEDTEGNFGLESGCKADIVKQKAKQSDDHQDKSCRIAMESELDLKLITNASSITKEAEMCKQTCSKANLETLQGPIDQKPDLIQSNTVNFGFSTAGGKEVKISEKALQNAKKLLNEVANDKETKHDNSPAKTKATSWTSIHNSSDVLAVLHDSKMSDGALPEVGKEHHFGNSPDKKQAVCPSPRSMESNGFKMASGKGVSVSASAIQKSKTIFKDIDDSVRSSDETKSTEKNAKLDLEGNTGQHAFVNGFKMASGKGVSFSEKAFMKAKMFFKNCDPDCVDISQAKGDDTSVMDDCGFEAVAGNIVHLPGMDSLNKETLKKDSTDLNKYVQRKFTKTSAETLQPPSGCGFSTASGAVVSVSTEALQRAKAMLDDSNAASPGQRRLEITEEKCISKNETLISGKSCSFSTASGRNVAISEKALQKAKSLFTDCDVDGLEPDPSNLSAVKTSATGPKHIRLPFNAASNKNIAVSEKELNKGKDEFVSCDDVSVDTHNTESHLNMQTRQHENYSSEALSTKTESIPASAGKSEGTYENMMSGGPKADHLGSGHFGFSTASGKGVCVSKSALEVAYEMFRDCDAQPVTNGQHKITSGAPSTNINKTPVVPKTKATSPSLPSQDNPSLLSHRSLNLDGCTVTQQKYFEQEAIACTKALLEDDLSENGLLSSLDTGIRQSPSLCQERCLEVNTGIRKRTSDDKSLTGQPPLKRRLVSEFVQISEDRTVCTPVKSSPNGTLRDRRIFKYNLKPNITYPSRNVVDQTSANPVHQIRRPSDPKAPVFIPPFQKNLKAEMPKNCVPTAVAQVPSVFVPPITKKNASGSVYVKDSPQISGDSPAIKSSSCENSRNHSARKPEDQKAETQTNREEKLENHTTVPCEKKVIWQQSLELAQDMQNMRIRKKKRQRVRPLPGTFYLAKTSGVTRVSLKEAVGYKCPELHTEEQLYQHGVSFKVSQITSENAEAFRFSCDEFFKHDILRETGGVQLADGGWLIPDNRGMLGKEEFYRALCDTPGVDPKLISEAWVYNHYRWVVWKRASMERAFPEVMGGRCLTPEQVLLQLKLRYDVEVDHSRRSALKKIMERDDTPAKTIVLCVCGIAKCDHSPVGSEEAIDTTDKKPEMPAAVIWLTDGWYSIKALLDFPLSTLLRKGRLRVGVKLLIHGAELIGSQDACPPLEAPDSLMLKISANSTRRARWDTKLGFHKDPRPFSLLLSSLYANGGVVSCVDIIVLRSYPTQWMEKKPGSVFVFRNERAEEREAARYNSTKQKTMELLFSKIQAQIEKEEEEKKKTSRSRTFSLHEIKNLQDGEELHEAMESDPAVVEAHLSTQQVKALSSYRRALTERTRAELQDRMHKAVQEAEGGCANRDVTPVWKLSIADSNDLHSSRVYTLNIWRPSVELRSLLREGCRYKAYHLATSETKKRSSTSNIQFTATKKTQFQDIEVCPEWLSLHFPARQSVKFRDLQSPGFSSPCGEVDVVGYVISILDRQGTSPVLYFVDEKFDFVSVRICSSLAVLVLEDLVKPLALLAVSNLQLRQQSGPVPSLYAGEQALFSTNPKEPHLQEDISHLKTFVEDYEHFFTVAEEKLSNLIPTGFLNSCESPRTPGLPSVPKPNVRNNVTPHQTSRVFSPFTPVTKRPPIPTGNSDSKDPKSVKRKRGMEYLSRLQNPAPLVSLGMVRSPRVSKTFNPPRRCETPRNPQTVPTPPPENK